LDAAKYLGTGELFKTEGIKVQNAWVDGITSQPVKNGVSLFKTLPHPVMMCKIMKCSQIVKTIFALLMFIIQTEKKTPKGLPVFPVKMLHILDEDLIFINMLN